MMDLKLDAGRPYQTCILSNGQERNFQENPCKDAFAGCDGSCKRFRVALTDGSLVGGEQADQLMAEFWGDK